MKYDMKIIMRAHDPWRLRKSRVFVAFEEAPDMVDPGGWGSQRGVDPTVDAACDQYKRAQVKTKRRYAEEALRRRGYETKIVFSRTAGCSCGCSPGFVAESRYLYGVDVFVDVLSPDYEGQRREDGN